MSYEHRGMGAARLDPATIRASSKTKYASYSNAQLRAMQHRYEKYMAQWASGPRLPIPPYPTGEAQKNLDAWAGQELKFRVEDVVRPPVAPVAPPAGTSLFTGMREEPVIRPCNEGAGYSRTWLWMHHAPHYGAEPGAEELARDRHSASKARLEARGCAPTGKHEMTGSRMAPAYGDEYCCPPGLAPIGPAIIPPEPAAPGTASSRAEASVREMIARMDAMIARVEALPDEQKEAGRSGMREWLNYRNNAMLRQRLQQGDVGEMGDELRRDLLTAFERVDRVSRGLPATEPVTPTWYKHPAVMLGGGAVAALVAVRFFQRRKIMRNT